MKGRLKLALWLGMSLLFLAAGLLKLVDVEAFSRTILRYQLVEGPIAGVFALWVPWLEVVGSAGFWARRWRMASIWLFFSLLIFFQGALLSALIRGLDIDCGCLGAGAGASIQFALIRNLFLLVALGWLAYVERPE